jgi:hypothetical protein
MRRNLALPSLLAALSLACAQDSKSSAGFYMPDGDPVKGQAVFVSMRCNACHSVAGVALPAPVAEPPVSFVLGGEVPSVKTDGDLAGSIIAPSHRLRSHTENAKAGQLSRMGDFSEAMSVRELIDVVAFLQSRYKVVVPPPPMK